MASTARREEGSHLRALLLEGGDHDQAFRQVLSQAEDLISDEHFSVDGTISRLGIQEAKGVKSGL